VISCLAWSPGRGIVSLSTAGVPSASVASATNASVELSKGWPTVIDQSCSSPAMIRGRSRSQPVAPAASALLRSTG
jgi:hypothetical protein